MELPTNDKDIIMFLQGYTILSIMQKCRLVSSSIRLGKLFLSVFLRSFLIKLKLFFLKIAYSTNPKPSFPNFYLGNYTKTTFANLLLKKTKPEQLS